LVDYKVKCLKENENSINVITLKPVTAVSELQPSLRVIGMLRSWVDHNNLFWDTRELLIR